MLSMGHLINLHQYFYCGTQGEACVCVLMESTVTEGRRIRVFTQITQASETYKHVKCFLQKEMCLITIQEHNRLIGKHLSELLQEGVAWLILLELGHTLSGLSNHASCFSPQKEQAAFLNEAEQFIKNITRSKNPKAVKICL